MPFLPLFYRQVGMQPAQIGVMSSISGVVALCCAPGWALIADGFRIEHRMVSIGMVAFAALYIAVSQASTFALVLALNMLLAALPPMNSICDAAVLSMLGERRNQYGALRMWGSLGWSITAAVVGWLIASTSLQAAFVVFGFMWAGAFISVLQLPRVSVERAKVRAGSIYLLRNIKLLCFLGAGFLMSVGGTFIYGYRALFMQDLGIGTTILGFSDALSAGIEVPVMFLSARIIQKVSPQGATLISMLMFAVCGALQLLFPTIAGILTANTIRGIGYGLWIPAGVVLVQALSPRDMIATAQSLLGVITYTLAALVGNAVAGYLYQTVGYATLFQLGIALIGLSAVLLILGVRGVTGPRYEPHRSAISLS